MKLKFLGFLGITFYKFIQFSCFLKKKDKHHIPTVWVKYLFVFFFTCTPLISVYRCIPAKMSRKLSWIFHRPINLFLYILYKFSNFKTDCPKTLKLKSTHVKTVTERCSSTHIPLWVGNKVHCCDNVATGLYWDSIISWKDFFFFLVNVNHDIFFNFLWTSRLDMQMDTGKNELVHASGVSHEFFFSAIFCSHYTVNKWLSFISKDLKKYACQNIRVIC